MATSHPPPADVGGLLSRLAADEAQRDRDHGWGRNPNEASAVRGYSVADRVLRTFVQFVGIFCAVATIVVFVVAFSHGASSWAPAWDRAVPPAPRFVPPIDNRNDVARAVAPIGLAPIAAPAATRAEAIADPARSNAFDVIAHPTPAFNRAVAANDRCARAGNDQATCSARAIAQCDTDGCINAVLTIVNMAQRLR